MLRTLFVAVFLCAVIYEASAGTCAGERKPQEANIAKEVRRRNVGEGNVPKRRERGLVDVQLEAEKRRQRKEEQRREEQRRKKEEEEERRTGLNQVEGDDLQLVSDAWTRWYQGKDFNEKIDTRYTDYKNPYKPTGGTPNPKIFKFIKAKNEVEKALHAGEIDLGSQRLRYDTVLGEIAKSFDNERQFLVGGFIRDVMQDVFYPDRGPMPPPKDVDIGIMNDPLIMQSVCDSDSHRWSCKGYSPPWFNMFKWGKTLEGYTNKQVTAIETLPAFISVGSSNAWRDFTVNAIYYDMTTNLFIDSTGSGVEDCSKSILRIANENDGHRDKRNWYDYFDETWYATGTGARKVARWWHMRLKGFKGSNHSERYILAKMRSILTDGRRDLGVLVSQWMNQTLNKSSQRQGKIAKIFKAIDDSEFYVVKGKELVNKTNLKASLYSILCESYERDWSYSPSDFFTQELITNMKTDLDSSFYYNSDSVPQCNPTSTL